jgi:hypothetical protein
MSWPWEPRDVQALERLEKKADLALAQSDLMATKLDLLLATQENIMTNQTEEVTIAGQIETQIAAINTAQGTALEEITALQTAALNGQPLDFTALTQAVTDLGNASTGVQALATAAAAATPPAAPLPPSVTVTPAAPAS